MRQAAYGVFDRSSHKKQLLLTESLFQPIPKNTVKLQKQYGAEVMYRGAKLSDDKATTFMVLEDILDRLKEPLDYFMLLQPTSPLRDENHVREAVDKFERNMPNFDFLVSVKEAEHSAVLVKPIDEDESLKYFDTDFPITEDRHIRNIHLMVRYSLPNRMHILAGNIFRSKSISYIMNRFDSVDIDDELDYELACICMNKKVSGRI